MKPWGVKAENSNKILEQKVSHEINRLKKDKVETTEKNIISIITLLCYCC